MCAMSERAGPRPSERELCETQDCPFYQASRFGQCSATCGGGVRTRTVECVILLNKYKDMNGKTQLNVTDVNITQCGGEPPAESEMCNTFDCFYRWIPGRFGECGNTPSLGPPVSNEFSCKERPVTCVNDMQVPVNDSFCEAAMIPKPPILASCGNKNCFVGIWDTTRFSPCSKTCGYGMQERELLCLSPQTLTRVPTDFCDISRAPIAKRQCFVRNCENMCLRDENPGVCAVVVRQNLCDSQLAMGSSGLRCCVSCGMGTGSD
ncbi:ADAMTS-like protein 1 [Geodia barretti]|uniref:ADAMTS-like protein 1 n=1 Tax=Geodia barretti TaxID=519541 RepID=A0AA35SCF6_GEOBA|nr:ADAMTS-like protein 1 [Geodia barretti]